MKQTIFTINVTETSGVCPIGETVGENNITEKKVPVMSCEGACIRGEIARLAANQIARTAPGYARACHGELFSVPHSAMARWVQRAERIVVIDGCHLKCHGRIVENLVGSDKVSSFNAHARYQKYGDRFEIDSVPEVERKAIAQDVAEWVSGKLKAHCTPADAESSKPACGCSSSA